MLKKMKSNEMAKRKVENTLVERRKVGRHRSRWVDGWMVVLEDIKRLKIKLVDGS
jgi:hypothetical protein